LGLICFGRNGLLVFFPPKRATARVAETAAKNTLDVADEDFSYTL